MPKTTLPWLALLLGPWPALAAPPAAVDACGLLTAQEAAAALGGAARQPKPTRTIQSTMGPGLETAVSGCDYATGKGDLTLAVRRTTSEAAGRLRQMVQMVCQGKEAVPGVGEVACWYSPQHGELQALQGTVFLTVELHGGRGAAEALREVARKALARAPR